MIDFPASRMDPPEPPPPALAAVLAIPPPFAEIVAPD